MRLTTYIPLHPVFSPLGMCDPDEQDRREARGEWPVLLCAGIVGTAYPVTLCDDDFSVLPNNDPSDCKWYGKPLKTKYDTHFAAVDDGANDNLPCAFDEPDKFHELCFDQDDQILPLAIVWFKDAP